MFLFQLQGSTLALALLQYEISPLSSSLSLAIDDVIKILKVIFSMLRWKLACACLSINEPILQCFLLSHRNLCILICIFPLSFSLIWVSFCTVLVWFKILWINRLFVARRSSNHEREGKAQCQTAFIYCQLSMKVLTIRTVKVLRSVMMSLKIRLQSQ